VCLLALGIRVSPEHPVIVLSHRDEFFARHALPLHRWTEFDLVAGKDLKAQGTWLAFGANGRFGALTNVPDHPPPIAAPSRGQLIVNFLKEQRSPAHAADPHVTQYAGFHLVVGEGDCVYLHSHPQSPQAIPLGPGIHILSNGPWGSAWPKQLAARQAFEHALTRSLTTAVEWLTVLDDRCDRSAEDWDQSREDYQKRMFIKGPTYGTTAITAALWSHTSRAWDIAEQRFDPMGIERERTLQRL